MVLFPVERDLRERPRGISPRFDGFRLDPFLEEVVLDVFWSGFSIYL